jgi:2-polyprenyl-3-methyl-5-hydroxy-6-metoxy-1,4-benzoquinol methylase
MKSATSTLQREMYRERLYHNYLANHRGTGLLEVQARLQGAAPYWKRLLKYFPEDKDTRVLDLGCGYGACLFWLKQAGYRHLEGVDCSPEQVKAAHSLGLDSVKQGDLQCHIAERQRESCDVVIAFDVLEHFEKNEALQFADQVFRILAPGGFVIIHLPNGEGVFSGCIAHGDFTHELTLTRQSLGQLLRCAGFSQISAYEDIPVVHGLLSAVRFLVWKATRTALRIVYAAQTGDTGHGLILSQSFLAIARKS